MITVRITENTPAHMLRAIKAACNELLGEVNTADSLKAIALGSTPAPVPTSGEANTAESLKEIVLGVAQAVVDVGEKHFPQDLDSAGQPWDPEQHSSTRSKLQDGTWKKKRGQKAPEPDTAPRGTDSIGAEPISGAAAYPATPVPPTPPAPPAAEVVTMNQIWGLITNKTHTLDQVLAAAQAMGFADLGAVAQTATAEQRGGLLAKLTEEVQAC